MSQVTPKRRKAKPKPDAGRGSKEVRADAVPSRPREIGGRNGPDPTRYGDWEKNGRCIDF